jgi:hypothetical protein
MRKQLFFILSAILILSSCSKDTPNTSPAIPPDTTTKQKLSISPDTSLLVMNATLQLTAIFTPADTLNTRIIWSSSDNNIATVNAYGTVSPVSAGTVVITGNSEIDSKVKATAVVQVLKEYDVLLTGKNFYWRNGQYKNLPGGHYDIFEGNAITLSGNDVYIAGYTVTANLWRVPTYWKNENPVQLTAEIDNVSTMATSLTVTDTSVYIAGFKSFDPGCPNNCTYEKTNAFYWKSTPAGITEIPLFDNNTAYSEANAITTTANGDVLIAGNNAFDNYYKTSRFWKNQFADSVVFSGYSSYSTASAIGIIGNDVYVAGTDGCPYTNCVAAAKLWKNNSSSVITLSRAGAEAAPTAMFIKGQDIYISGYETNAAQKRVAKFWKVNGSTVTSFDVTKGITNAIAYSVYVIDDNVFLAGFEEENDGKRIPKYWRVVGNKYVEIIPYITAADATMINAIAVKQF